VLVAHPRTRELINRIYSTTPIIVHRPLSYLEMLYALQHSECLITDSGGLQKEAYFMQKPCITLRHNTEWTELVDAGVNFLAGDKGENIHTLYHQLKSLDFDFSKKFYGDGKTAEFITEKILSFLKERKKG
jgi:UDP-GlcNAc3NAcA epimerase